jgi:catechol 2,3-dioxygenase-like lactoylglutathione lyase family enzyme
MPKRSGFALKVNDLAASTAFYAERLGWTLAEEQPGTDMAVILDPDDHSPLLLAGPTAEDVSGHLDDPRIVFKPGDTLHFAEKNLDARLTDLTAHGLTNIRQEQTDEGDHKLTITDPSGYRIIYIQRAQRSPEETLALYSRGGEDVEAALAGLTEADLDLTRAPEEWSIRQIVHHLSESESLFLLTLKLALAQSGSTYIRNPYDQAHWAEALAYKERAVEPSLALIKASRQHLAHLMQHIPDYSERYVLLKFANEEGEGRKITVGKWLDVMNRHLAEHCAEIRETRHVHDR